VLAAIAASIVAARWLFGRRAPMPGPSARTARASDPTPTGREEPPSGGPAGAAPSRS
jgi:hypothetical protein